MTTLKEMVEQLRARRDVAVLPTIEALTEIDRRLTAIEGGKGPHDPPTRFYQGSRVVPKRKPEHDWQYDRGAGDARRSNDGKPGVVLKTHDGHGLCYLVSHDQGGQAWWEPDELTSEEATKPVDILRRIVATTPCTCAGWPHERCLICQAGDVLKVPVLTPEEGRAAWNKLYGPEGERDPETGAVKATAGQCCAKMRGRAVEAIEREIASVQRIRRLSGEERVDAAARAQVQMSEGWRAAIEALEMPRPLCAEPCPDEPGASCDLSRGHRGIHHAKLGHGEGITWG